MGNYERGDKVYKKKVLRIKKRKVKKNFAMFRNNLGFEPSKTFT